MRILWNGIVVICLVLLVMMTEVSAETVASADGTPISYTVYGAGEPTLVFIHGWCYDQSVWREQVPFFKDKYRVVTLDLAGHGTSGKGRTVYSMKTFGEDVAAVVKELQTDTVILVGHSMGGPVIIAAGEIIPDKIIALIGIDTLHDLGETYAPEQISEFLKPFKEDFHATAEAFVRDMFVKNTDPSFVDEVVKPLSKASPAVGVSALEEMLTASYIDNPPKVTDPVWCLNADLWPTNHEINRKYVPEFNLRIMPGVGHFLMLEKPEEFNMQLDMIITEIGAVQ